MTKKIIHGEPIKISSPFLGWQIGRLKKNLNKLLPEYFNNTRLNPLLWVIKESNFHAEISQWV